MTQNERPRLRAVDAQELEAEIQARRARLGLDGALADARERGYRRGYHDGWVRAIDTLWELVEARARGRVPRTFNDAYSEAWEFWHTGPLWEWHAEHEPDAAPLPLVLPPDLAPAKKAGKAP